MIDGRASRLRKIGETAQWDVVVIGGGASGLGAAVEAASRGYRTLLVERDDFAKGTSSRSTKLVHGGVRYLEQLNITLVMDALRERGYMLRNAPHLVHKLGFVVPIYSYGSLPYYGFGLKLYEWLSGRLSFGDSEILSRAETIVRLPTIARSSLKGGILYQDGQFDDARYGIALMLTLEDIGGIALNHVQALNLCHRHGKVEGVRVRDCETDEEFEVLTRVVINATGVFTDKILEMDNPGAPEVLSISQGTHFVLPPKYLPGVNAMMVPRTADGRVLFAIPWHQHLVIGTTDVPVPTSEAEPKANANEIDFLTRHIYRYFGCSIPASDILSVWSGLRPLVRNNKSSTSKLSRDHRVLVSRTGLVTIIGGKWTTYRKMGEDTINCAAKIAGLAPAPSNTVNLQLHGWTPSDSLSSVEESEWVYGSDLQHIHVLRNAEPKLNERLHPHLSYRKAEVVWAARHEQARTVEDVLARRTRALFLNSRAAMEAAPEVSHILAKELNRSEVFREQDLKNFQTIANGYVYAG